jgi:hypothetical protein
LSSKLILSYMELEIIMLSEVRQKDKHHVFLCMWTLNHIYICVT